MTTANTENEDLKDLVTKPKKDELRPQGPVSHQSEPIDSSGGSTMPTGPVSHQSEPVNAAVGIMPKGPVSHQTEPTDTDGEGGGDGGGTTQPDGPVSHQKTEPKAPVEP